MVVLFPARAEACVSCPTWIESKNLEPITGATDIPRAAPQGENRGALAAFSQAAALRGASNADREVGSSRLWICSPGLYVNGHVGRRATC